MEFENLREKILKEKKLIKELISVNNNFKSFKNEDERRMVTSHLDALKNYLKKINESIENDLQKISVHKLLYSKKLPEKEIIDEQKTSLNAVSKIREDWKGKKPEGVERETIKRLLKKEEKVVEKKYKKPSVYVRTANKIFSGVSMKFSEGTFFRSLKRDLVKASLHFVPSSYISVILFTTMLSFILAIFIFLFFMFFNITAQLPIITLITENMANRFLKTFWILFIIPTFTFLVIYVYPALESKTTETKINQELPLATIHMSAISGSMINPTNIFKIIISTKEYLALEKEFIKLINSINIYGYDLVNGLRLNAFNSPSKKLSDLYNGLATTITSGGSLPSFFEKRSQTLLLEYRLEREKYTRAAETFMDIYISVVIAAPMILMLLLMMMKISGLGISLSTGMITLIMILGVGVMNIFFLTFLHLKQPSG